MRLLNRVTKSSFLRQNFILLAGSVAVGVLNYAYYPVLGRLLEPAAFGEVQTLVSLFLQLTIFLTVLGLVVINLTANWRDKKRLHGAVFELEKVALAAALGLLLVVALASEWLRQFFQFESAWPFVILALALVASVPFTFRSAFLRGRQRFAAVSAANLITAAGKLAASVFLVLVGFGTSGAVAGLVVAQAVAFGYAAWRARVSGLRMPADMSYVKMPRLSAISEELKFSFFVLLGSLAVMLLFSVDVLIAKRFFDADTAGLYAGVATVARILFFLTASVAQVLLPAVRLGSAAHGNRRLLVKSILLMSLLSAPLLVLFLAFPGFTVSLLMGNAYAQLADLLPTLAVANFTISIINLLVLYFLALRRAIAGVLAIIGFAVSFVLMLINHTDPQAIATSLLLGSIVTLILIAIWATRGYVRGFGNNG